MGERRTRWVSWGAVGIAAGGAAVLAWQRRQGQLATGEPMVTGGRWARNAALAGVGSKAGGAYALHRARRVFADAERRDELDAEYQLQTAEQVAEALGNLKGAV